MRKHSRHDRAHVTAARDHRLACGSQSRAAQGGAVSQAVARRCPPQQHGAAWRVWHATRRSCRRLSAAQLSCIPGQQPAATCPVAVDLFLGIAQADQGQESHDQGPDEPKQAPVLAARPPLELQAAWAGAGRWGEGARDAGVAALANRWRRWRWCRRRWRWQMRHQGGAALGLRGSACKRYQQTDCRLTLVL